MILTCLGLSVLCGVLYRVGGSDLPLQNKTKYRDAGCPLIGCIVVAMNHWPLNLMAWLGLVLSFGLAWGAMTTYFKRKGSDARWWNWMLVGLAFGIAFAPFAWAIGAWVQFGIRTALCVFFIASWSQLIGWDVGEEFGRGFIFCSTLLIFNIGG